MHQVNPLARYQGVHMLRGIRFMALMPGRLAMAAASLVRACEAGFLNR